MPLSSLLPRCERSAPAARDDRAQAQALKHKTRAMETATSRTHRNQRAATDYSATYSVMPHVWHEDNVSRVLVTLKDVLSGRFASLALLLPSDAEAVLQNVPHGDLSFGITATRACRRVERFRCAMSAAHRSTLPSVSARRKGGSRPWCAGGGRSRCKLLPDHNTQSSHRYTRRGCSD